jgi:hypothetical protein
MSKGRYEKPQKGNPHGLIVSQHVFPAASIARFAGHDNRVEIYDLQRGKPRRAGPKDNIFCAMRAWTNKEDSGFMKDIEDAFQGLARNIIDGTQSGMGDRDHITVNNFYSLWKWRADHRQLSAQEIQLNMVTGVEGVTRPKDEEEMLEKAGIIFVREGGTLLTRQLNGAQLYLRVHRYEQDRLAGVQWGIIRTREGEFLVPDAPFHAVVPLTPTLCLVGNAPSGTITRQNLADINRGIKSNSRDYYFAHDLAASFI